MKKLILICFLAVALIFSSCGASPANASTNLEESITTENTIHPQTTEKEDIPLAESSESGTSTEESPSPEQNFEFFNPLTGLPSEKDFSLLRPAAIMINNIYISLPQIGVSKADIMYECLVEGGYTRLMMVVSDYESLGNIGSVRSARDYYIDMAANHDALFIHAGGSPDAYSGIKERKIDNLDGVNMYTPSTFFRDEERIRTMGLEHSLTTTGEGIASGIKFKGYRTEKSDDYPRLFKFFEYGTKEALSEMTADKIDIPYSLAQNTIFEYDGESKVYLRSQNGEKHIDGENGEQLAYENVFLIFCSQTYHTDGSGRIDLEYTGSGSGYYACGGMAKPIKWSKTDKDSVMKLENMDGEELVIGRGKSAICIVNKAVESLVEIS